MNLKMILTVFLFYPLAFAQSILVDIEYFIDTDQGFGNCTPVTFTPGTNVEFDLNVDFSGLSFGLHKLYVRAQDDAGKWSVLYCKSIYKKTDVPNLTYLEYFIDTDQGFGNGIPITFTPGANVEFDLDVDLNTLSLGLHKLYVRGQDSNGNWNVVSAKAVYKKPAPANIESLNYFISSNGTALTTTQVENSFTAALNVDITELVDLTGLAAYQSYGIEMWGMDQNGLRSVPYCHSFTVIPGGVVAVSEIEPNDIQARATAFSPLLDPSVQGLATASVIGSSHTDDQDWFSFSAQSGDQVSLTLVSLNDSLNMGLILKNSSGITLESNTTSAPGSHARINYTISSTGTYSINCEQSSGGGMYRLVMLLFKSGILEDDLNGSNNVFANAENLNFSALAKAGGTLDFNEAMDGVDEDWFKGYLQAGQVLHVRTWRTQATDMDPAIEVLDHTETVIASDTDGACNGVDGELIVTAPIDGTYYTRVYPQTGNAWDAHYVLEWRAESARDFTVELEGNDAMANATVLHISPNVDDRGVLGCVVLGRLSSENSEDWFLLPVDTGDRFYLGIKTTGHQGLVLDGQVVDETGLPLATSFHDVLGYEVLVPNISVDSGQTPCYLKVSSTQGQGSYEVFLHMAERFNFAQGSSQYRLTSQQASWQEAEDEAQALGGHLVTIDSAKENQWLVTAFGLDVPYWTGFNNLEDPDHWTWASGSGGDWWNIVGQGSSYVNWLNGPAMNEGAAVLNQGGPLWWDDLPDDTPLTGIMELPGYKMVSPNRTGELVAGDSLRFAALPHSDMDVDRSVLWDFGDGRTSTDIEPGIMSFQNPGIYVIQLQTLDAVGNPKGQPSSLTLEVIPNTTHPNLAVLDVIIPETLVVDVPVNLQYQVQNQGNGIVAGSDCPDSTLKAVWHDAVYVSDNLYATIDDRRVALSTIALKIDVGETYIHTTEICFDEPSGETFLVLAVDSQWELPDHTRLDNERAMAITVQPRGCYDFNEDGLISILDHVRQINAMGCHDEDPCYSIQFDLNQDGEINLLDARGLNVSFQQNCHYACKKLIE